MDSLLNSITRIVDRLVGRRLDHLALYPARVVSQAANAGPLDLVPDDPRAPSCQGVPYVSLPGVRLVVPAGTRVLLGYAGGDPSQPRALLWELGDVTRLVVDGGTHPAAREGHATENGGVSVLAVPVPGSPPTTDLHLTYTPPGGAPQIITVSGLPAGVTASGSHTLEGAISEGTDVLHLP